MIYFTTLIFTLLLSHIARAMPACGDVASPEDQYDAYDYELVLAPGPYKVTWDDRYDHWDGNTMDVACSNGPNGLAGTYPKFHNFPSYPYLGGAFDTHWGSPGCGQCWRLTNKKTGRSISITAIDSAGGFNIGKTAFLDLNGGTLGSGTLDAEALSVSR